MRAAKTLEEPMDQPLAPAPATLPDLTIWASPLLKADIVAVVIIVALVAATWAPRLWGPLDTRWDGGVYYILGTSLAEGKGYRLLNEPGDIRAVQYPPLLPVIVAAAQRILKTHDVLVVGPWLRVLYVVLSAALTLLVYGLARAYLAPGYALAAALISALSMNMYYLSDVLYTEIPFALVTVLFVLLNRRRHSEGAQVAAGLLVVVAFFLRTAGIALLAAWVGESMIRRRFGEAAVRVVVALLPIMLWQVHISHVQKSVEYRFPAYTYQRAPYQYSNVGYVDNTRLVDPFYPERGTASLPQMARRIGTNLLAVPMALGETVSMPEGFWRWAIGAVNKQVGVEVLGSRFVGIMVALLGCLVMSGMAWLWFRGGESFIPLYFMASIALICLTPWPEQFTRYLTPLTPFLAVALLYGLAFLSASFGFGGRHAAGFITAVLLMVVLFVQGFSLVKNMTVLHQPASYYDAKGKESRYPLFFYSPLWRALDNSLEWVRQRAHPRDVIAATVPHSAYLRTGLKTVLPPMVPNHAQAQRLLDSVPVKYLVVDTLEYPGISQRYAAPLVAQHPEWWQRVYVSPGGQAAVYERIR